MSEVLLPPYDKPYLTVPEQLDLLESRGMSIGDRETAAKCLARIGYYRLKSYWFPFRERIEELRHEESIGVALSENFRAGTEFRYGVDLYIFDKQLRLVLLDAIERIEVAFRVAIAHTVGLRGTWAHHDIHNLDPNQSRRRDREGRTQHDRWLERANKAEHRSRADWVAEYRENYCTPLPLWMAVELWDFGVLSQFLAMARQPDRMTVARLFAVPNPEILVSWVRVLAYVRNLCAHHARVWNNPIINQPTIPRNGLVPQIEHVASKPWMQSRIYGAAAVAQHFLDTINPTSMWKHRLSELWARFPEIPGVSAEQAGFYAEWEAYPLWSGARV